MIALENLMRVSAAVAGVCVFAVACSSSSPKSDQGPGSNVVDAGTPCTGDDCHVGVDAVSCRELAQEARRILDDVATCNDTDECEHSYLGSGCSDSTLPLCGFAHVSGADLTRLAEVNGEYEQRSCASDGGVCAACAPVSSVACVSGRCVTTY